MQHPPHVVAIATLEDIVLMCSGFLLTKNIFGLEIHEEVYVFVWWRRSRPCAIDSCMFQALSAPHFGISHLCIRLIFFTFL